jgi:hypothetical protein
MVGFPTPGKGEQHTIALGHHGPNKINKIHLQLTAATHTLWEDAKLITY